MSAWLDTVVKNGGEKCGNCGAFRVLHTECCKDQSGFTECEEGFIEQCSSCGDSGYNVYGVEEILDLMTL